MQKKKNTLNVPRFKTGVSQLQPIVFFSDNTFLGGLPFHTGVQSTLDN